MSVVPDIHLIRLCRNIGTSVFENCAQGSPLIPAEGDDQLFLEKMTSEGAEHPQKG